MAILDCFAISDRGLIRPGNEDIALLGSLSVRDTSRTWRVSVGADAALFFGVADGVGGAAAGEIASERVATAMATFVPPAGLTPEELKGRVSLHCSEINRDLVRQWQTHSERAGMATTLTGVVVYGGDLFLIHAGDSRCYRFRGGRLRQISNDHTLRAMTGNSAIPGNIIANCFGSEERFFIDFLPIEPPVAPDELLLLCSDGLSDMLSDDRLAAALGGDSLPEIGERLVQEAKEMGGADNITLILASIDADAG